MVRGEFNFPGRIKRPPSDSVNALLFFSYTKIFSEISSLLDGLEFDSNLGYFHTADYGRASGLIEEFRVPIAVAVGEYDEAMTLGHTKQKEEAVNNVKFVYSSANHL